MADNYLERRMDDLRSGRLKPSLAASSAAPRKGVIQFPFPQRRVLVTGGANGIGREVALQFLKAGCKVAIFDIDRQRGEAMAHDHGARFINVDLRDEKALETGMKNLFDAWNDIDIVVNNAGISEFRPLTEDGVGHFDNVLATNLRPAYIIARSWALRREELPYPNDFGGRMIIISSTRHIQSEAGTEAYSASKGGLASMTHALMMSLAPYRITANCISPGWIHTGDPAELSDADHVQHPSGRVGVPADVARLCLFLAVPGNDFINGADIPVDGGMTRRMIYV